MSSASDRPSEQTASVNPLLQSALEQFREECYLYNEAVGSFNTHLDNHRDRRDLHDVPFREPITAHEAFGPALEGNPDAIDALITYLIDQGHLDSRVRRHPRSYPVHVEAVEHLELAREPLVSTLEEALHHTKEGGQAASNGRVGE